MMMFLVATISAALWEQIASIEATITPWNMLASNTVACNQGDLFGYVERVELLSIGHSKNVYLGEYVELPSDGADNVEKIPVPVVLKEYRVVRPFLPEAVPSTSTLEELWSRAPRLSAAFYDHTTSSPTSSSILRADAAGFLQHHAHGNLATSWSADQLALEIDALFAGYDTDGSESLEPMEVSRWLFDRLYTYPEGHNATADYTAVRFRRACEQQLLQRFAYAQKQSASHGGSRSFDATPAVFPKFFGRCTENTYIEEHVKTVFTMDDGHRKQLTVDSLIALVQRAARLESRSHLTFLTDLNEHNLGFRVEVGTTAQDVPAPLILDASYCQEDAGETFRLPQFCNAVRRIIPGMVPLPKEEVEECLIWDLASIFANSGGRDLAGDNGTRLGL